MRTKATCMLGRSTKKQGIAFKISSKVPSFLKFVKAAERGFCSGQRQVPETITRGLVLGSLGYTDTEDKTLLNCA